MLKFSPVSICGRVGLLDDPLKLLLARPPLHLGQVEVADQGPGVRVLVTGEGEVSGGFRECSEYSGAFL